MDADERNFYDDEQPFLKPLLQTASSQLMTASGEVINTHDQYEVRILSRSRMI